MQIIAIDRKTFDTIEVRLKEFYKKVNELCQSSKSHQMDWLDNADVCRILNISKRTLQTYRNLGILGYSRIDRKTYYKRNDVNKLLEKLYNKAAK